MYVRRCTILAILAVAHTAAAQKPQWEKLFEEGVRLRDSGKFDAACERFQKSFELDPNPGGGVVGNLADCAEKHGDLPKAWHLWNDAGARWKKRNDKRGIDTARERAASVAARATTVVIAVPESDADGLVITLGGERLEPAAEIHEVVAPGEVVVTATRPGLKKFEYRRTGAAGDTLAVAVTFAPVAEPVVVRKPPPVQPPPPPPPPPTGRRRVKLAIGIGITGLVGVGAGITLGVIGKSHYDSTSSGPHCDPGSPPLCDSIGKSQIADAQRLANAGTVVGVVGAALGVTALVVYLTAPRVAPVVTPSTVGIAMRF
jgi:hypothetical protein